MSGFLTLRYLLEMDVQHRAGWYFQFVIYEQVNVLFVFSTNDKENNFFFSLHLGKSVTEPNVISECVYTF